MTMRTIELIKDDIVIKSLKTKQPHAFLDNLELEMFRMSFDLNDSGCHSYKLELYLDDTLIRRIKVNFDN